MQPQQRWISLGCGRLSVATTPAQPAGFLPFFDDVAVTGRGVAFRWLISIARSRLYSSFSRSRSQELQAAEKTMARSASTRLAARRREAT